MKAVNLIPRDARRGGVTPSLGSLGASHLIIGLLAVAVAMVTLYVLSSNKVSDRKAQLAGLHQQMSRVQAEVARLQSYQQFEKLAQAREATVKEIASGRFNWNLALNDLSKVIPANTKLESLVATVSTNTNGVSSGGGGGNVRGAINAPAFALKGCTGTQDEVAQIMGRLRLVTGVTRVTLEDSSKTPTSSSSSSATTASGGCVGPTFDMVVFFQPLTGTAATVNGVPTSGPANLPGTPPSGPTSVAGGGK